MNDLEAIVQEFLQECPSCDLGLPKLCECPERDYRPTMLSLVKEIEILRKEKQ